MDRELQRGEMDMVKRFCFMAFVLVLAASVTACGTGRQESEPGQDPANSSENTSEQSFSNNGDAQGEDASAAVTASEPEKRKVTLLFQGDSVTWRGDTGTAYPTYAVQQIRKSHPMRNSGRRMRQCSQLLRKTCLIPKLC